jgi:hypothetical protein
MPYGHIFSSTGSLFFLASNYFCVILDLEMSESDTPSNNHTHFRLADAVG